MLSEKHTKKSQNTVNPAKPEYRNMCPKICSIHIYVKIALTKKKKKKIKKISPAKKLFFCDIYVTYGLEGCIINV